MEGKKPNALDRKISSCCNLIVEHLLREYI